MEQDGRSPAAFIGAIVLGISDMSQSPIAIKPFTYPVTKEEEEPVGIPGINR